MRLIKILMVLGGLLVLPGCASLYFDDAGEPPWPPPRYAPENLPFSEYWTGLVFNGSKIGFTHLSLEPEGEGLWRLRSEAAMHFRFLGVDKKVTLKADDRIADDLTLQSFGYDYDLDGTRLEIEGAVEDGVLTSRIRSGGSVNRHSLDTGGRIYPASVINLYPVVHGLEVGREYVYRVYDGETQSIAEVRQRIADYQTSELFAGPAFRVVTTLHGQEVESWIDAGGLPRLEMSINGIFIAGLESEAQARRYLTLAALKKSESLLEFSRVPGTPRIESPRQVRHLTLEIEGLGDFEAPSGALQRCVNHGRATRCVVGGDLSGDIRDDVSPDHLRSTLQVPSRDPRIRRLAQEIAREAADDAERVDALVRWIQTNIEQQAVDVFSALDVLQSRKAECQGNTYLYSALSRALGIPTRVVNGLVYSEIGDGFLYHTWAESFVDGEWIPVDATFGQSRADATHLKLIEGESLADLGPLTRFMGRLKARVIAAERKSP